MGFSVKWNGREVRNPIGRVLLGTVLAVGWAVMMAVTMVLLACIGVVAVVMHLPLRAFGLVGTIQRPRPGKTFIGFNEQTFRRRGWDTRP